MHLDLWLVSRTTYNRGGGQGPCTSYEVHAPRYVHVVSCRSKRNRQYQVLTYPPTANMTMLRLSIGGGQSLRQGSTLLHRFQSVGSCCQYAPSSAAAHHFVRRSFADDAKKDPPKGTSYSKLTVGVPKETFPLEKRVAATPDVSLLMFRGRWHVSSKI